MLFLLLSELGQKVLILLFDVTDNELKLRVSFFRFSKFFFKQVILFLQIFLLNFFFIDVLNMFFIVKNFLFHS